MENHPYSFSLVGLVEGYPEGKEHPGPEKVDYLFFPITISQKGSPRHLALVTVMVYPGLRPWIACSTYAWQMLLTW